MKEHHNKKEKKKLPSLHPCASIYGPTAHSCFSFSQSAPRNSYCTISSPVCPHLFLSFSLSLSVFLLFSPSCCLKLTLSFSHLIQHPKKRTLTPFVWQRVTRSVCVVAAKGSPTTNSATSFSLACSMHPSEPCSTKSRSATTMGLP